jgi:hypothetical protein
VRRSVILRSSGTRDENPSPPVSGTGDAGEDRAIPGGTARAIAVVMRRVKLLGGCLLLIVASLPLLPGRGSQTIEQAIAILEGEFAWMRRLMDAAERG